MNRNYRSLFNATLNAWVAVPETAKAQCKAGKSKSVVAAALLALGCSAASALDSNTLPNGGNITAGSGSIDASASTMTVSQSTSKLAIDWQSFNIGSAATVNFVQPSSSAIALNRVVGSGASEIYGKLNANGQVFLLNPNGILFGKGAEVNVGGLVASTLSLSNADFLAGNYRFTGTAGSVTNEGSITAADGGYVALLGGQVGNQGAISARLGNVSLAAGSDMTLDFVGDGLLGVTVNQGALNALAENKQLIQADGGQVLMTAKAADALIQAVVNNEGVIEANAVDTSTGKILLLADMDNGVAKVGGTLQATGGFVETSGHTVSLQSGATVKAKNWLIDPADITIDATEAAVLVTALDGGTDVEETTSSGGSDAGDITVASAVTWTGTGTLTLNADNNIAINADITGNNGGLTLSAINNISTTAAVNVGTFDLQSGTWSQINSSLPSFSASDFRLSGGSFIRALGGNGSSSNPYRLADIYGVQGIGSDGMLAKSYVLANDIDATGTSAWNSGAGFKPIGSANVTISNSAYTNVTVTINNSDAAFTGSLDGQNHVIDGLTINRPSETLVGLFGYTGSGASIANLGLTNASTAGYSLVGALAGYNTGNLDNIYATGTLIGDAISDGLYRSQYVGGLVGYQVGDISNSHYSGSITGQNGYVYEYFGGLAGYLDGDISNSYAEGSISGIFLGSIGQSLHLYYLGGLAGYQAGDIGSSHADVDINVVNTTHIGATYVGGLAGWFTTGSISDSYATGDIRFEPPPNIQGAWYIGGLVGYGDSTLSITDSHYSGSIFGDLYIGGLIGYHRGGGLTIDNSDSTGDITGRGSYVGGLVGYEHNSGGSTMTLSNSHYSGALSGTNLIGGLVAKMNAGAISNSYAEGTVSGYNYVGGLVGASGGTVTDSYSTSTVTSTGSVSYGSDGYVGGLIGLSYGNVSNSHATGNVIATGSDTDYVGGLIGYTYGAVSNSYATGNVTVASSNYVGGLIGYATANVSNTYATGDVTGYRYYVGGLVGMLSGSDITISDSHATGTVIGSYTVYVPSLGYDVYNSVLVGGLVGQLNGDNTNITNSYATGNVTGGTMVGGLVGGTDYDGDIANHQHFISNSYATGDVTATYRVINFSESGIAGGLVGQADGLVITNSYATGNVSGRNAGGLVGWEYGGYLNDDETATDGWGRIVNSYATGSVTGGSYYYFSCTGTCTTLSSRTGGLLGFNQGGVNIINSYAVGAVSSTDTTYVGGLSGGTGWSGGTISNSFWNTETTGQSSAVGGSYTLSNVTGLTTAQMMTASNFSDAGWDISTTSGSSEVWRIYEGYTYPLLRSFLTSLTVTPAYDGSGTALTNIADLTGTGSYDSSLLLGSATSTTLTLSSSSAGSYTASANAGSSGLYSTQQGYDLSYADRTITTTGSAAGDIVIDNPITWTSGTLAVNTSGTVTANAAVNGSGSAIFDLQAGAWSQISSSLPSFSAYDFRISGGSFIRALAGNGTSSNPYQLADIYGVQGIGSDGMQAKSYVLANDIDASGSANWNSASGFKPIGDSSHTFTGSFNGQSHTIDGLTINRDSEILVGLFGINYGTIGNLTLTNADVTGNFCVGALVGCNMEGGAISNVSVQGSVVATDEAVGLVAGGNSDGGTISNATASGSVSGVSDVGGLVGVNWGVLSNASASVTVTGTYDEVGGLVGENAGSINSSHATGNVSGDQYVGGLVGHNAVGTASDAGQITDVYATGTVFGSNYVGGLIGSSDATTVISNAYATGNVTGATEVGGLVGLNEGGNISVSYATGNVTGGSGSNMLGGLVGYNNSGSISASYASGSVSGDEFAGGLVGWNHGSINTSYATGAVTANLDVAGGLVGDNTHGSISNSYATGSVNSTSFVGGLAGANEDSATISNSYATGAVTGNSSTSVGGLAGINTADSSISNSFFNSDTSGQSSAVGGNVGTLSNVTCKTTSELKATSTFSDAGWDISTTGGSSAVWRIYDGDTTPLLRAFLTSLTVSLDGGSKIYDGSTDVSSAASYSIAPDASLLLGTLSAATSSKKVGSYSVSASGLYSTQQGYDISYESGTVTITAATLTVTGTTAADKTYDGTRTATVSGGTLSGVISGDSVTLSESGTFSDKNVGTGKTVTYTDTISGTDFGNYVLASSTGTTTADISAATLTVTGTTTASDKTYDGTTTASVSGGTLSGLISGDAVSITQSGSFSDKTVGTGKTVTYIETLSGSDSGNYVLASSGGTTTADITAATLTVTANSASKWYDGTAYSGGNGVSYSGFGTGDDASVLSGTLAYGGSSQGAKAVGSYVITPSGLAGSNYTLVFADGRLVIRPNEPYRVAVATADNVGTGTSTLLDDDGGWGGIDPVTDAGGMSDGVSGKKGSSLIDDQRRGTLALDRFSLTIVGGGMRLPAGMAME